MNMINIFICKYGFLLLSFLYSTFLGIGGQSGPDIYESGKRSYFSQHSRGYFGEYYQGNGKWDSRYDYVRSNAEKLSKYSDKRCLTDRNLLEPKIVTVNTRFGDVIGANIYLCDGPGVPHRDRTTKVYRNISIFLGIPFAKPPTKDNNLRFKPPKMVSSWGSITALEYKHACPQDKAYYGSNKGVPYVSEDCLYLNVFSPSVSFIPNFQKYPVMVYIHGGSWDHGSSNEFPAHMLAASQEVVVVTFNYRLGVLGFLATGDNSSAGNFGLLDQAMAIQWVFDNINYFNGDHNQITLFGPGVGAASAGLHLFNKRWGSNIRRVIAQSGSAVAGWATITDPTFMVNNSLEFAKVMRCYFKSTRRIINCLQDQSLADLQIGYNKHLVGWSQWAPVIDGYTREKEKQILSEAPEKMFEERRNIFHHDFSYMAGVTKDEALPLMFEDRHLKNQDYKVTRDYFKKQIKNFVNVYNYTLDPVGLTRAIEFLYLPCEKNPENITLLTQSYINMLSDSYFKAPNDKILSLLLLRNVKTYMYVLNYSLDGVQKVRNLGALQFQKSVPHNTEYYLITGAPFLDPNIYPSYLKVPEIEWTEADRNMSEFFMTAWANFVKFGNPTPSPLFESIKWYPMTVNNLQYLSINTTNYTTVMMSDYRQKESQFWNIYLPSMMNILTTWPPSIEPWEEERNIYSASLWGVLAATTLFIILSVLFCCLYCRAKSKHLVSTEYIFEASSTSPTSVDELISMRRAEGGKRYFPEHMEIQQKHTQV